MEFGRPGRLKVFNHDMSGTGHIAIRAEVAGEGFDHAAFRAIGWKGRFLVIGFAGRFVGSVAAGIEFDPRFWGWAWVGQVIDGKTVREGPCTPRSARARRVGNASGWRR